MLDNEWGMTKYPFVPGHEVVGTIAALGNRVTKLNVGQRVGLGKNIQLSRTVLGFE
ncbi:MAG: alcohol dehydrogenase catalytic domain-containing protein [Coleofasciculus sp. Co-bin14]|nr:alcohol dehydrogenase catalytic domain-containing protein [Coleofasciculus sp. Co-bin14]